MILVAVFSLVFFAGMLVPVWDAVMTRLLGEPYKRAVARRDRPRRRRRCHRVRWY